MKDPVCGMELEPEKVAAQMDYAGTTYYFCFENCHRQFHANPTAYIMSNKATPSQEGATRNQNLEHVDIPVGGITCDRCVQTIEKTLQAINGVNQVGVNRATGTTHITYHSAQVTLTKILEVIRNSSEVKDT
ncbi:YHS domain-containing protein [Candidatus Poribacteria bacterium]|nr:YHS domain-containing protein [Candidatus Poribacteria bacterium]